jgi:hydroxymethylpyrimidine/phosphomethylpyrimidine kinase
MSKKNMPVALTIAGSDSGGGAGIQADLKTFAALGVHGTSAVTCVTAQNPKSVSAIEPCSAKIVRQQIDAVFSELPPNAVKTGMLYSEEIVRVVVSFFETRKRPPLVVDPVMISTSEATLLKPPAQKILMNRLFPLATLVTPNLDEVQVILGERPKSVEEMRRAAKEMFRRFGCAVLVKGGHLRGAYEAADIFYDGAEELLLTAPFVRGMHLHGTGCTYSAAIAAQLARGHSLSKAVKLAKDFITQAIAQSLTTRRGHVLLAHFSKQ